VSLYGGPKKMSIPSGIRKDKNMTASALFGVAAILILVGGLGWFLYSEKFSRLDWIVAFSGGIYIALGIAARWIRLPAAVVGIVLCAAYLIFQATRSIELLMGGLIIKIPVVILLIVATVSALRCQTTHLSTEAEKKPS
jgi:hypothetical protein